MAVLLFYIVVEGGPFRFIIAGTDVLACPHS